MNNISTNQANLKAGLGRIGNLEFTVHFYLKPEGS
jgi:hypothetical protein